MNNGGTQSDFLNEVLGNLRLYICNDDKLGVEKGKDMTLILYRIAREIKNGIPGYMNGGGNVDIARVIENSGLEVQECHLNSEPDFFDNEISGYLDASQYSQNSNSWKIYINSNISGLERRYVIAHEVSHYILDFAYGRKVRRYCCTPVFPRDSSEQACDMLSSFLLMPLDNTMESFQKFRKAQMHEYKKPRKVEFIKYLAYNFVLTDLQAAMCFEHVRHLAGILYEKSMNSVVSNSTMSDFEQEFKMINNYRECFR